MKRVGIALLLSVLSLPVFGQGHIRIRRADGAEPSSATTVIVNPLNMLFTKANDGAAPITDTCLCMLALVTAMDEISHVGVRLNGGSTDSVEEIGVYSYDGATKYFDGAITNVVGNDRKQVANTLGTVAVPQGNVWICVAKDSTSAGWTMARANDAVLSLDNYRHTETCTDGLVPDTLTSSTGAYNNNRKTLFILEDLD